MVTATATELALIMSLCGTFHNQNLFEILPGVVNDGQRSK